MTSRDAPPVLDLAAVAAASGGELVGARDPLDPGARVRRVEPDVGRIRRGDLFVALPGERLDGHDLVALAAVRGASAAVVSRRWAEGLGAVPLPLVVVDEPEQALLDLASWWRDRLGAVVVGITGSVGKTTTKELVAAALSPHRSVVATPRNRNTGLGVALTLLEARAGTEVVVLEVGGGAGPDEIAQTCRLARPDIGIVISVHPVHLETMGSLEAIARSKADLVRAVAPNGRVVLNRDDPWVRAMADDTGAEISWFGHDPGADVRVTAVWPRGLDGLTMRVEGGGLNEELDLPFLGDHAADLVAAALAAAGCLGVTGRDALAGLASAAPRLRPSARRGLGGCVVVDDAYSASPPAVMSALRLLETCDGHRVAVLGDMLELGPLAVAAHEDVGRYAASRVDHLVTIGELARLAGVSASRTERAPKVSSLDTPDGVPDLLAPELRDGTVVLVKGSRALRLDGLVERLSAGTPPGDR